MKQLLWILPVSVFAFIFLLLAKGLSLDPRLLPSTQIGKTLPEFSLPALNHPAEKRHKQDLVGQPFLLNVWASWCQACVQEQVFLMDLADQGVPIVGLNYKDKPADARHWLKEWGNPYQEVLEDLQGRVAMDLGVYGAPETFVIDAQGKILYRHVGVLDAESWHNTVQPLLVQAQGGKRG